MSISLYKLYGFNSKRELEKYFSSISEKMFSLIPDELSISLTKHYLEKEYNKECDFPPSMAEELLLINDDYSINENGMKIVSMYPFFGKGGKEKNKYPSSFFQFFSSLLLDGKSERSFSLSSFTSLFPREDEDGIKMRVKDTIKFFKNSKIIDINGNVNLPLLRSFMKIDELSKIYYIVSSNSDNPLKKHITFILSCLKNINALSKDEEYDKKREDEKRNLSDVIFDITKIVGISGEKMIVFEKAIYDLIYEFSLLDHSKDSVNAFDFSSPESGTITLSSSMEISVYKNTSCPLFEFAEPVKNDEITLWNITKSSVKRAFNNGLTGEGIISLLEEYSSIPIPENVKERILDWEKSYRRIKFCKGITLLVDNETGDIISSLPALKKHIVLQPSQNIFIMDEDSREWYKTLSKAGFDMIPDIPKNKSKIKNEEKEDYFKNYTFVLKLKDKRDFPFDKEKYNSLLKESTGYLEKCAISSSLLFENRKLHPKFTDPLDYKQKENFLNENFYEYVYVVLVDGRDFVSKIEQTYGTFDNRFVRFSGGERIRFNDIYKLSSLPKYFHPLFTK